MVGNKGVFLNVGKNGGVFYWLGNGLVVNLGWFLGGVKIGKLLLGNGLVE